NFGSSERAAIGVRRAMDTDVWSNKRNMAVPPGGNEIPIVSRPGDGTSRRFSSCKHRGPELGGLAPAEVRDLRRADRRRDHDDLAPAEFHPLKPGKENQFGEVAPFGSHGPGGGFEFKPVFGKRPGDASVRQVAKRAHQLIA